MALAANQRTNTRRLAAHRIQRIEAGEFDVELGAGGLVESLKCLLGTRRPVALGRARIAADTLQMSLQQARNVGLIHHRQHCRAGRFVLRRQRGDLSFLLGAGGLDLLLCIRSCLRANQLHLPAGVLGLLLRLGGLSARLVEFLLGLFCNLLAGLFKRAARLFGELLLGFLLLASGLLLELAAEAFGLETGLLLGLALRFYCGGAGLFRNVELLQCGAGEIGIEAGLL